MRIWSITDAYVMKATIRMGQWGRRVRATWPRSSPSTVVGLPGFHETLQAILPHGLQHGRHTALAVADARDNSPQRRDTECSVAALAAWQADAMRRTVNLNREGDRRGAKHYLSRELRWMEPYARDLPGAEPLLAEMVLLLRRADEEMPTRFGKALCVGSTQRMRGEQDLRSRVRESIVSVLQRKGSK